MDSADIMLNFIGACGAAFKQMDDLAHNTDTDPPWYTLMDIDTIPDEGLPWLGQFVGTVVDPNLTPNQQRDQIRKRLGWQRGTINAIISTVRPLLTGTQTVAFIERDTSPYHFNIATYGDETPDQEKVLLAIQAAKPAGLQFTYTVIGGSPATADTYENLFIDFPSYQDVYTTEQSYQDVYINP